MLRPIEKVFLIELIKKMDNPELMALLKILPDYVRDRHEEEGLEEVTKVVLPKEIKGGVKYFEETPTP